MCLKRLDAHHEATGTAQRPRSRYQLKVAADDIFEDKLAAVTLELEEIERLQAGDAAERFDAAWRLDLVTDDLMAIRRALSRTPLNFTAKEIGREVFRTLLNREALLEAEKELGL